MFSRKSSIQSAMLDQFSRKTSVQDDQPGFDHVERMRHQLVMSIQEGNDMQIKEGLPTTLSDLNVCDKGDARLGQGLLSPRLSRAGLTPTDMLSARSSIVSHRNSMRSHRSSMTGLGGLLSGGQVDSGNALYRDNMVYRAMACEGSESGNGEGVSDQAGTVMVSGGKAYYREANKAGSVAAGNTVKSAWSKLPEPNMDSKRLSGVWSTTGVDEVGASVHFVDFTCQSRRSTGSDWGISTASRDEMDRYLNEVQDEEGNDNAGSPPRSASAPRSRSESIVGRERAGSGRASPRDSVISSSIRSQLDLLLRPLEKQNGSMLEVPVANPSSGTHRRESTLQLRSCPSPRPPESRQSRRESELTSSIESSSSKRNSLLMPGSKTPTRRHTDLALNTNRRTSSGFGADQAEIALQSKQMASSSMALNIHRHSSLRHSHIPLMPTVMEKSTRGPCLSGHDSPSQDSENSSNSVNSEENEKSMSNLMVQMNKVVEKKVEQNKVNALKQEQATGRGTAATPQVAGTFGAELLTALSRAESLQTEGRDRSSIIHEEEDESAPVRRRLDSLATLPTTREDPEEQTASGDTTSGYDVDGVLRDIAGMPPRSMGSDSENESENEGNYMSLGSLPFTRDINVDAIEKHERLNPMGYGSNPTDSLEASQIQSRSASVAASNLGTYKVAATSTKSKTWRALPLPTLLSTAHQGTRRYPNTPLSMAWYDRHDECFLFVGLLCRPTLLKIIPPKYSEPDRGGRFNVLPIDSSQVLLVDEASHQVRLLNHQYGVCKHLAGCGKRGYLDGPLETCRMHSPCSMTLDPRSHYIYVADRGNHVIRKIDLMSGLMSTVVGTGTRGNHDGYDPKCQSLDSPFEVSFVDPHCLVISCSDNSIRCFNLKTLYLETVLVGS